jgi:hypothetical protein
MDIEKLAQAAVEKVIDAIEAHIDRSVQNGLEI